MSAKDLLSIFKTTFAAWNRHEAPRLGAALAFYTILSLSPLVIIVVALAGLIFSRSTAQAHVLSQVQGMIGLEGGKAMQAMLANAQKPAAGILGTIVGLLSLFFGASGVFTELRSALNLIWEVDAEETSGVVALLRERFFSFGMVLSIGFLLLVSLVISAVLAAAGKFFGGLLPIPSSVLAVLNFLLSYIGVAVLFGLIFRFVPEAKVRWRNVWPGALATALFFTIGKTLIGLYLGKSSLGSAYGAAGSVIVVIVWVYYSAQIFFFGAELTHAYSERRSPSAPGDSEAQNTALQRNGLWEEHHSRSATRW
jgi:membrane protein